MIFYAFAVIATGSLVWRVDRPWRAFSAPSINVSRQVDMMYPTYVPARKLAGFAKNIGTSPDTFDVAPTPVEAGVRADFASGKGNIAVVRLEPRKLLVSVESQGDARVRFSQLYFPLWTILPKTGSLGDEILGSSDEGHIEVSLTSGRHDFELLFDSPNKILKCAQLRHASAAGRASRSSANHTAAAEFEKSHEGPGSQLRADPLSRPPSLAARAAPPDVRGHG